MRRRRQKNTLLPKMLGLAVLINAILLPILARLGVFKSVGGQRLIPVQLVQAPPPPPHPKERARKPHPRVARRRTATRRAPPAAARQPALTHPNLIAAKPGAGGGSGPTVNPNGTGQAGQLPTTPTKTQVPTKPPINPPPTAPAPTPPVAPVAPPVTPPPVAPVAPPPHVPVLVRAVVLHQVDPQIPTDFVDQSLPATFRAAFHVRADGTDTVETVAGTGDGALDRLALDAARRWTFRPATEDGRPVDSYLRLTVHFVPNDEG